LKFDRRTLLLYAVTDRSWLGDRLLSDVVEEAVRAGVTFVQLREKDMPFEEFVAEAKLIKAVTDRLHVPFVINDSVEVALAAGADGVHIGQGDCAVRDARAKLGPGRILGVSAQTVEQAVQAERDGADYLGVGAMFPTATKADADAVKHDTLKAICSSVSIPVVAIGGICEHNVLSLCGSGISGIAVISAIFAQPDAGGAAERLRKLAEQVVRP
jgi:thiamine-phosphate pyrophosphorylase